MHNAVAADDVHVVAIALRFIAFVTAGIQLACWITASSQWFFGAEDSRFEGEKLIYRS